MMSRRHLTLAGGTATLLALCLACFGPDMSPPDRNTCDDAATTATLSRVTVNGGWSRGIQGVDMLSASVELEGSDVPACATITVVATSVETGREVWRETAGMEMEESSDGTLRTRGLLFTVRSPDPADCEIVVSATAYGVTGEITDDGSDFFVCDDVDSGPPDTGPEDSGPVDAGPEDSGPVDAGTIDAGTIDAGTVDAGTTDAGTTDAGTIDAGTIDAGTIDASPDSGTDAGVRDSGASDGSVGDGG